MEPAFARLPFDDFPWSWGRHRPFSPTHSSPADFPSHPECHRVVAPAEIQVAYSPALSRSTPRAAAPANLPTGTRAPRRLSGPAPPASALVDIAIALP